MLPESKYHSGINNQFDIVLVSTKSYIATILMLPAPYTLLLLTVPDPLNCSA